jgi:hypothetical protein
MSFTGSTMGKHSSRWLIIVGIIELAVAALFVFLAVTLPSFIAFGMWLTAAILGVTGLVLILIGMRVRKSSAATDEILSGGMAGTAQITGLTQTGMYLNEQPQVSMDLLINLPGRPPYPATRREFVPLILLGRLTSGQPLPVRVDPADPQKVVIDWQNVGLLSQPMMGAQPMQAAASEPSGSSGVDESLNQVHAALAASGAAAAAPFAVADRGNYSVEQLRQYLRTSGLQGEARIDKLTDTGQIVGDERLYTMQVTLSLPGREPQQLAESAAMVPLRAMHKVRVGWKVPVRVAADNSNLMMFEWDKV